MFFTQIQAVSRSKSSHILVALEPSGYSVLEKVVKSEAPVGSLLKPFAAWYLLERGQSAESTVFCPPLKKRAPGLRCWTEDGHGAVDMASALVHSCNYYFVSLFAGRNLAEYEAWLRQRFDWPANLTIAKPVQVYGFDLPHGIDPENLIKMYWQLLQAAENRNAHAVSIRNALTGICRGTLADFCKKMQALPQFAIVLGKTGTVQSGKYPYGIVVLLVEYIPTKKKMLLLCYEHKKTGSQVAMAVPAILKRYVGQLRKNKGVSH